MKFGKKVQPYFIFLTKQKMIWLGESLKNPVILEMNTEIFQDLEFKNSKSLENQLNTAFEQKLLKPNQVVVILSQELFYSLPIVQQTEDELKAFLALIPFDETVSKQVLVGTQKTLVAVGSDLIEPLISLFLPAGFEVLGIVPHFVFGEALMTAEQFTAELIPSLLSVLPNLELQSLYVPPKAPDAITGIRDAEGNIFSPRLVGMIIFFVLLIGVLVVALYMNGFLGGKPTPSVVPRTSVPAREVIEQPTAAPEVILESSSAAELSASTSASVQTQIQIEVLNGSGVAGLADQIKGALATKGFQSVTTGNSQSSSQSTVIIYKPGVNTETLTAIAELLTASGLQTSSQENAELTGVDIRIITGQK